MTSVSSNSAALYKPILAGFGITVLSVLVALLAPIGSRVGLWDYDGAVAVLKLAAGGFGIGALLSLFGAIMTRPGSARRGFAISLLGLVLTSAPLGLLYYWQEAKTTYPPTQDISTDPDKPPEFWTAPNSRVYDDVAGSAFQMEFYPDIEPLIVKIPPGQAYDLALVTTRELGWQIQEDNRDALHLEATETTFWFGFSDDVVVHITPLPDGGSRIDVRSASRFGSGGDGGTNARRIRRFFRAMKQGLPPGTIPSD